MRKATPSILPDSLLLQSGDHVVEAGALLHEVVDLLADGAVAGERRVEVDHDAVEPVLQEADPLRHVVLVARRGRRPSGSLRLKQNWAVANTLYMNPFSNPCRSIYIPRTRTITVTSVRVKK